ncbi:CNNM domain-containing protein [Sulfuriroseicoccus oceanibius]|uniref:HlyC/CorC family transporter n=1 Tax=Sulfuriroseicoccus oceanibius TaxID=2707525 RepID=A0A6B3LCN5_9BACT|nr:hemolysin family protein [Sulfuriroseicoccus oceanibius]QQL45129.1 HlyC/CorC family transporter [Sulfuriroseicoccus oceanibius]
MGLLIFFILLALGVSFLCSVLEAVLLSVTPGFIEHEVSQGKPYAKKLAKMKADVDKPLSAILTYNTVAHTFGAAGAGAQWKVISGSTYEATFATALTVLILVASEIIPKTLGARFWRSLAKPATWLLGAMVWSLRVIGVIAALRGITRLLGGDSVHHGVSRAELAAMADLSSRSGHLEDQESQILRNLFRFRESKVRDIMTPRTVVYALPESMDVQHFLDEAVPTPFSRIPVFEKNSDDITGFVLKSDVMAARVLGHDDGKSLVDFKRPVTVVPSSASISRVFEVMMQKKAHFMLVVDEFGGLEGIVTMEDVVETLLGLEIVDEADASEDMQILARKLWQQRAKAMGLRIEPDAPADETKTQDAE